MHVGAAEWLLYTILAGAPHGVRVIPFAHSCRIMPYETINDKLAGIREPRYHFEQVQC